MRLLKFISLTIMIGFVIIGCVNKKASRNASDSRNDTMAIFKESIPAYIEEKYVIKFGEMSLKYPNLVKKFTLDYQSFKKLIENHKNYAYTKFYFIQDAFNSKMNLGVTFSNNNDYKNISSDDKYILINNKFQNDEKLQDKIKFYQSSLATQTGFNGKPATECVIYDTSVIKKYYDKRENEGKVISRLDLAMIYFYMAKNEDNSDYDHDSNKHDRISFAVHSIYSNGSIDEGFDAGDLKP
ncbi:hypothetical protein SAMN05421856_104158 [Chryseobacterium taichungense]|uniref:Lipoprotein n=1 Tax=Chryseobacterium taichungense TaxID=295069 RepID=A0A1H7ZC39_9FLAO|nr:hypothetical protein [Chryseobacterium taichungense]SEM55564.1 hypothetical protein SAMN05421856_104158 [Chryseobacterium taichungense]